MQFSAYNPSIINIKPVKTLHWTDRPASIFNLPVAAEISDSFLQLTDFNSNSEDYLVIKLESIQQALDLSFLIYSDEQLSPSEWMKLYNIADKNSLHFETCPAGFNKDKFRNLILCMINWKKDLTDYISSKNVPWKTIQLIALLPDMHINIITDFVLKESPSLQSFRQFVEKIRDYQTKITSDTYDKSVFNSTVNSHSHIHTQIEKITEELRKTISPVSLVNKDNFETNILNWTFSTENPQDLARIIDKLTEAKTAVEILYKMLNGDKS